MNWDKIEQLLKIAEGAVKFGAPLRPIHDAAMKELHEHANPLKHQPASILPGHVTHVSSSEPIAEEPKAEAEPLKRRAIDG